MGIRLIHFTSLKPGCWFVVPKCMKNKWTKNCRAVICVFKTHDSTGVFHTLCYCKLTRFLCKWNIGRKRVNITSNLDSSYTLPSTAVTKSPTFDFAEDLGPPLGAWLWKNYISSYAGVSNIKSVQQANLQRSP